MNKRKIVPLALLLFLSFWIGTAMIQFTHPSDKESLHRISQQLDEDSTIEAIDTSGVEDILDIVRKMNGSDMPKPPTEFRKGHVTPSSFETTVKTTDYGYLINLPATNGVPSPTYDKGNLYVSGGFGSKQYFRFDAKTGKQKWSIQLDDDGPSSAVVKDGIVVFNTESCTIFACEEETGEQLWSLWLGDPLMSTPTISGDLVITTYPAHNRFGSAQHIQKISQGKFNPTHAIVALELRTGKIVWQKWVDGDAIMAPVADKDEIHLTTFTGTYFVFDKATGDIKSAQKMRGTSAPTICENGVLMSKRSDDVYMDGTASESIVFSNGTGAPLKEKYKRENAEYLDHKVQNLSQLKKQSLNDDSGNGFGGGAPASANAQEAMYNIGQSNVSSLQSFMGSRTLNYMGRNFNTMGDSIVCTEEESGEAIWKVGIAGDSKKEGGFMGTAPVRVGNRILIATFEGDIILYDGLTGDEVRRWKTDENIRVQPIAEDGWIFASTANGKVIAINTEDATIAGWPMLGKNIAHTN